MILAAGLGTRIAALSALRPKPALPVRGVPLVAHLLEWLAAAGVTEVIVNLHHRADLMRAAAERCRPPGVALSFSPEPAPLGTGGGIARAAGFLRASDPSIVIAGDMLIDTRLDALVDAHRARDDAATLLLRSDPRAARFGSIGLDAEGVVRRIGASFDLGGAVREGLFVGVRLFSPRAFDALDRVAAARGEDAAFEDLRDWLAPELARGARDVRGALLAPDELVWEPVGTLREYLDANLSPPALSYAPHPHPLAGATRVDGDVVIGDGAIVEGGARLARAVVWDGERVPASVDASDGVFAGGRFHRAEEPAA
ncbi:MAG: NDP-sugar synthase [Myxococcota bacterium]